LIKIIENLVGRKAAITQLPSHPADMFANWADVSKARQILGWVPEVDLFNGISRLIDWYNAERTWARDIATD
jgi:nucleoside-diphosphate-sugar epimerase